MAFSLLGSWVSHISSHYGRKVRQPNFPLTYNRNRCLSRVLWLNDAAAEKMELMFLSFLIDDYDILREDRRQRSLARNLNAASARPPPPPPPPPPPSPPPPFLSVILCTAFETRLFLFAHARRRKARKKIRVTVRDFDVESESEKMTPRAQSSVYNRIEHARYIFMQI